MNALQRRRHTMIYRVAVFIRNHRDLFPENSVTRETADPHKTKNESSGAAAAAHSSDRPNRSIDIANRAGIRKI